MQQASASSAISGGSFDAYKAEVIISGARFLFSGSGTETEATTDQTANGRNGGVWHSPNRPADFPINGLTSCIELDNAGAPYPHLYGYTATNPTSASIEMWVKKRPGVVLVGQGMSRGSNQDTFSSRTYYVSFGEAVMNFRRFSGSNATTYSTTYPGIITLADEQWHHLVWTYVSGTGGYQAYIDGQACDSVDTSGGLNNTSDYLVIGGVADDNDNDGNITAGSTYLVGPCAEYAGVLSAARVLAHYEAATQG